MKTFVIYLSLIIFYANSFAQTSISLQWQKSYGGSGEDQSWNVQQTTDGGYIIAGKTDSDDGDVTVYHGGLSDFWVVKINSSGTIQWQKTYGGSGEDWAWSVQQTADGGYIIAGQTGSNDGDVTGNYGGLYDYWVVKTDSIGTIQWQKTYGGSQEDWARSIRQTSDGGYVIAGCSNSHDFNVTGNHGYQEYWIVKTDALGAIQWQKCYGGSLSEAAFCIRQTIDEGYIIAGRSTSNDGDVTGNHGCEDYWVVKTDQSGVIQWQKCYGGSVTDWVSSVQQTTDGGYIITGSTSSNDGDVTSNHGSSDSWIVKTDPSGTIQWQKCYGGSVTDWVSSVQQTTDGVLFLQGGTSSTDGDVTGNHGSFDDWIVKINSSGVIQWQKCFGGSFEDWAIDIQQPLDGGYIIAGLSGSNDGDVTGNHGYYDYWIVKLCYNDPLYITISDTSYCYSTILSATTGFTGYLWSSGDTTQTIEVSAGGIYSVIATNLFGCPSESEIVVSDPIQPYSGEQICMVTLDSITGKNVIVIEKTLNVGSDSILIYRMDNQTSLYQLIGSVGIDELSKFTDDEAIPGQQNYQYKISVKDTCGGQSGLSEMHKTILLQANSGINHEVNLFWNPYEGFAYSTFEIYRSTAGGPFLLIANVPNTTYAFTDLTPPSEENLYQVRVSKESPCVPAKSLYTHVRSNVIISSNIGIDENQQKSFNVYPNPASEYLTINVKPQLLGSIYTITDQSGSIVLTGKLTSEISGINISEWSSGVYTFKLGEQSMMTLKVMKK